VIRARDGQRWLFVLNHSDRDASLPVTGTELITGATVDPQLTVPAAGAAVVRL